MSFILAKQRDQDVVAAFERYRNYVQSIRDRFPRAAFEPASSDWYFNLQDRRCPHEAWLENIAIGEPSEGQRSEIRSVTIRIRLLGAYHDGFIELYYPQVFRYSFDSFDITRGHRNWRYDEFRLSDNEHVIHEVEWRGPQPSATWVIEASDVQHQWIPKA